MDSKDDSTVATKWYHVNREAIPSKVAYIVSTIKDGCTHPFINLFLISIGLSPFKAGLVTGLSLIGSVLGSIFWGMMTDWSKRYQIIIVIVSCGASISMLVQPWIPNMFNEYLWLNQSDCNIYNATNSTNHTEHNSLPCQNTELQLFWTFLCICTVAMFFDGYFLAFVDSVVMNQCTHSKRKMDIGRQRAFGSAGISIGSLLFGALVPLMSSYGAISKYSVQHFLYPFSVMCLLVTSPFLIKRGKLDQTSSPREKDSIVRLLLTAVLQLDVLFFLATVLFVATSSFLSVAFVTVLMNELKFPDAILGVIVAAGFISGFFMYFFATIFIRIFRGTFPTLLICCVLNIARFGLYSYTSSPYVFLVVQLFHPFMHSVPVIAALQHTKMISPQKVTTSMYGVLSGTIYGAGRLLANIEGGSVYQSYGGRVMYRGAMYISIGWSCLVLMYMLAKYIKSSAQNEAAALESADDNKEGHKLLTSSV